MSKSQALEDWINQIRNDPLTVSGSIRIQAEDNLHCFEIASAIEAELSAAQLGDFLVRAFRETWKKVSALDASGLFYAWFDEMSGTLRCSFVTANEPDDLPFNCSIVPVRVAGPIVKPALEAETPGRLQFKELRDTEWSDPLEDDLLSELLVMVLPIGTQADEGAR